MHGSFSGAQLLEFVGRWPGLPTCLSIFLTKIQIFTTDLQMGVVEAGLVKARSEIFTTRIQGLPT
jgi:hypothetical protein